MSVDLTTIKAGIIAWVKAESGLAANRHAWAEQNAPSPDTAYVTLRLASLQKVGDDYIPMPDNSGAIKITGNRDFTLGLQAYGPGALGILETLRSSLAKESVHAAFIVAKIAIVNSEDVLNTTTLVQSRFQEQASLDIMLRTYSEVSDNLGKIEKAEITETYKNALDETVLTDTYTIDSTI